MASRSGLNENWTLVWFQLVTAASLKMAVFCDVMPRTVVEFCRRIRCLIIHRQAISPHFRSMGTLSLTTYFPGHICLLQLRINSESINNLPVELENSSSNDHI